MAIIAMSVGTAVGVLARRLYVLDETYVRLTTEATYGMIGFLTVNAIFMSGRVYAAWKDRAIPEL